MTYFERAVQLRPYIERSGGIALTDNEALQAVELFPAWAPGIEITQAMIDEGRNRFRQGKQLYKTTVVHTTIAEWPPATTPTVWTPIDIEHTGTKEDPIPAAVGLMYKKGLYYIEDGVIYLCTRQDTEDGTALFYLPSQLVSIYFEVVSA